MNTVERELDWGEEISKESEYTLLPAGDYNFKVVKFERKRHAPTAKLPACPQADLTIDLWDDAGNKGTIIHSLFLHTKMEGMLSAFFIAIGQKKHGQPVRMNWDAVYGATGRCKVKIDTWKNDKGEERQNNKIAKFYEPEAAPAAASYTTGSF